MGLRDVIFRGAKAGLAALAAPASPIVTPAPSASPVAPLEGEGSYRADSYLGGAVGSGAASAARTGSASPGGVFLNVLTGMGFASHDKSASTFISAPGEVLEQEATWLYRGDGLAARVVDLPTREALRQGYEVCFEGDGEADVQGWADRLPSGPDGRKGLDTALLELVRWAEIYGGAALYLVCADGRPAWQPLDEMRPHLVGVRVLSRYDLWPPGTYSSSPLDLRAGELWWVRGTSLRVHPSRLVFVGRSTLPVAVQEQTQGWSDSIYLRLYRSLAACGTLDSTAVGVVNNFVTPVQKMAGLGEKMSSNGARLLERLGLQQLIRSMHRVTVLDENESFEYQTTSITGLPELLDRFPQRVCSITGIPLTLLMGMSPAGLNATGASDVRFFYDNVVAKYQEQMLRPVLLRVFALALSSPEGPTAGVTPPKWGVEFEPLYQLTELEREQVALTRAQRDKLYIEAGVLLPAEVAAARFAQDEGDVDLDPALRAAAPTPVPPPAPAPTPAPTPGVIP